VRALGFGKPGINRKGEIGWFHLLEGTERINGKTGRKPGNWLGETGKYRIFRFEVGKQPENWFGNRNFGGINRLKPENPVGNQAEKRPKSRSKIRGRGEKSEKLGETPRKTEKIVVYSLSREPILSLKSHPPCVERAPEAA
jgi:hypothetical protein